MFYTFTSSFALYTACNAANTRVPTSESVGEDLRFLVVGRGSVGDAADRYVFCAFSSWVILTSEVKSRFTMCL